MSTATTAQYQNSQDLAAEKERTPLPLRSDTFLGVCEAIGEDLGINPNWIRVLFAPVILINPVAAIGGYLALGAVVAGSRWLFPAKAKPATVEAAAVEEHEEEERLAA
jgi:phage shock protein PspC (stress-responsive transcriptional regulator)